MNWTSEQYKRHFATAGRPVKEETPLAKMQALGRLPGGEMNKTEKHYQEFLSAQKHAGNVLWFSFEPINIRLGKGCFYRADFLVMLKSGALEVHEVKGHWTDDALVKFKVAAALLPMKFKAVRMKGGAFEIILEI
jgi:hypothetical protein